MLSNTTCISPTTGAAPATFSSALHFFMTAQCLVQTKDWPPDYDLTDHEEFDFIVVGAGTAGSIVANRLSEITNWKVLLLEAGDDPPVESEIPFMDFSMYGTKFDWQYSTVNNGFTSQANKNGRVKWTRGKMLGGSGSINVMAYAQGNPHDYQTWYDEGNTDWHPDIVKKYFRKAENLQDPVALKIPKVSGHYGNKGPLIINTYNETDEDMAIINNLLSAWNEIGIKNVEDLNVNGNLGSARLKVTVSDGKRVSSATAYLNPIARNRNNLKIAKNAYVTKIIFDGKKAVGVEIDRKGIDMKLFSKREIIISTGTINTPQLLMLSGIGPKGHLELKKIKILVDSPMVGQNLQDHTRTPIPVFVDGIEQLDKDRKHFQELRYIYDRKGYLSNHGNSDVVAFYSLDPYPLYPKSHVVVQLNKKDSETIKVFASEYISSVEKSILEQSFNKSMFLFMHVFLHPYSKGYISLKSSNPYDHPLIYFDNYSDSRDLNYTAAAIKKMTEIVNTKYFKSINAVIGRMDIPACNSLCLNSIEYWECIAINMANTLYHPTSTAKMGSDISNSVVDSRLKVHGVDCLRVVDASVMPRVTSTNTNAPTVMIAERASDLIKEDYGMLAEDL